MPYRALVCDDDLPVRRLVADLLVERGVEVLEAADGQEALAIFLREPVNLVVTDFLMPRVDGMQLVRNIRLSGPRGQSIPVVLMSAISRGHVGVDDDPLGPDHYINKPFKPRKMAKLLDRVLEELHQRSNPP